MRLALPKGRLMKQTATLLEKAGVGIDGYDGRSRSYRLTSSRFPELSARVFQERDIPIQVAIGNYDLGICGHDWVEELTAKYPSEDLMVVRHFGYGRCDLFAVASIDAGVSSINEINQRFDRVRIVSEYHNLAELFALKQRFRRFSVLPIYGGGEVYPPESADIALIAETSVSNLAKYNLVALNRIMSSGACLIANRKGIAMADLSQLLSCLQPDEAEDEEEIVPTPAAKSRRKKYSAKDGVVRLAIPDGHLSQATTEFLERAKLNIDGYVGKGATRRPTTDLDEVTVKVIRPQDMPLQVANDNFDLAITGEDWLRDHLCRFPSSPVEKLLTLGFGAVKLVAVVSETMPASSASDLKDMVRRGLLPRIRVASEYVNIADRYAFDNHLERCKIIPTWGASEAFIPDDADLLIENTETGETLKRHRLKVIDTLLDSSACLIGHRSALAHQTKKGTIEHIVSMMKRAC
jgi:ATP phosphoribosyltransferase